MFKAISSMRTCAPGFQNFAGSPSKASGSLRFSLGPTGPASARNYSTLLPNHPVAGFSGRSGTLLSRPRVFSTQNRELHIGAAGALHAFKDRGRVQGLREPTIVSTILTRDQALKLNPKLPEIEEYLMDWGHSVEYEVDLRQLHNVNNQATLSLMKKADQLNVDLTSVEISYLRSFTEKRHDDDALMHDVARSLRKSGVEVLHVTHVSDMHNLNHYNAPSLSQWMQAATAAGFKLVGTHQKEGSCVVESVPNDQGRVTLITPLKPLESTFASVDPLESGTGTGTGVAASARTEVDAGVSTKT